MHHRFVRGMPRQPAVISDAPVGRRVPDGERLNLVSPSVRADTLLGLKYAPRTRGYTDSVTVGFSEIRLIEQTAKRAKVGMWIGLGLGAAFLVFAVVCAAEDCFDLDFGD